MRRAIGAVLFVLGACAPAGGPSPSGGVVGPMEFSAAGASGGSGRGIVMDREIERTRRVGARVFEAAFELCGSRPGETARPSAEPPCSYSLEIGSDTRPGASIRGRRIRLSRGLVRFAARDPELAFAIAHEVAHDLLRHGSAPFGKSRKSLELEADLMGLCLLARAGYPLGPAAALLKRMESGLPRPEYPDPRYPTHKARAAAIVAAVRGTERSPDCEAAREFGHDG